MQGIWKYNDGSDSNNANNNQVVTSVTRNSYLSAQKASFEFLIYGGTGWIGGLLGNVCEKQGIELEYGKGCFEDRSELLVDIRTIKPTHVFNAPGVIGELNVKWFEDHKWEIIHPIVVGVLTLADVCRECVSFRSIMPLVVVILKPGQFPLIISI